MKKQPSKSKGKPPQVSRPKAWKAWGWCVALVAVGALSVMWLLPRRHVNLNVKDADVKEVLASLARQSRQTILVAPETTGKVTIQFRKKPISEALDIVTGQTSSGWREYYAVGESVESIGALKQSLVGGGEAAGWPSGRGGFDGFGGFRAGLTEAPANPSVSYSAGGKPAKDVALALSYRTLARVIVADALSARMVDVHFESARPARAVAEFARQLGGRSEHFFVVRPAGRGRMAGPPAEIREGAGPFLGEDQGGRRMGRSGRGGGPPGESGDEPRRRRQEELTPEERQERRAEAEQARQTRLEAMTPEQRQQEEQMRAQFEQLRQQSGTMTPDQQMQAVQQILASNPQIQERGTARVMQRLKNTTPEQRVERYRRLAEAHKRFEERRRQNQ